MVKNEEKKRGVIKEERREGKKDKLGGKGSERRDKLEKGRRKEMDWTE